MIDERMTAELHIPMPPSLRQQIEALARADSLKPTTKARQLILAGLAAQKSTLEVHRATID